MRLDDELFVNRCLEGDQAAFTCLVSKYKEMVHAYAYYRLGNYQEAQDIAQEVFIKAYSKLGQLKWPHRFQSWLYSIVANECKMWLRKRSKERGQEVPLEDVPERELNDAAMRPHDDEDMEENVIVAMESLPADSQLALSLYYMSDLSIKEIAYFLGTSPGNVKVKLHRARKQLGERLEKMLGKHLSAEKLKAGFVFKIVNAVRDMPIPSLPKPRSTKWIPIPISIGLVLLIGIIGFGISSDRNTSPDAPVLKPVEATFSVSLLQDTDGQTISDTVSDMEVLDMGAEDIYQSDLVSADIETTMQTKPIMGTASSGIVVRKIWNNAHDFMGLISPDGRYLSYVNWDKGNVAIHDFETGESRNVTDEGNWGADEQFADVSRWSPDSKQIAYLWFRGPSEKRETSLRIVGIDGSRPRVLCSTPPKAGLFSPRAWSRDGKYILAFHCKGKRKEENKKEIHDHEFVLVSVADGSIRILKSMEGHHLTSFGHRMSLSPDNRYVVYDSPQSEDSENRDILLLATDGSHEIPLVEHPADDFAPFWSPDGNWIVFTSDRSGSMGIWVLEVVDGKPKGSPQLISDALNGMCPLGLTQDGSYYYGLPGREDDIYFADLDPETGKVVEPPYKAVKAFEGKNNRPAFSPDGKRLAYISNRRFEELRSSTLIVRSLKTGEERELQPKIPVSGIPLWSSEVPRWSPDGRSILVIAESTVAEKKKLAGFHQINVETGAVTPASVDDEQNGIYVPVWSPDGSKMFFMRRGEVNTASISVYDLKAKRERSLDFRPKHGNYMIHAFALSPDGQQLAFLKCFKGHSIQIAPSAGGETREVLRLLGAEIPPIPDGEWLAWTPDGRYVLFAKRRDKATELWRIPAEGGEPENLGLAMGWIEHLSIHPDGRRIAFTGPGPSPGSKVWAMENFLPTASK